MLTLTQQTTKQPYNRLPRCSQSNSAHLPDDESDWLNQTDVMISLARKKPPNNTLAETRLTVNELMTSFETVSVIFVSYM